MPSKTLTCPKCPRQHTVDVTPRDWKDVQPADMFRTLDNGDRELCVSLACDCGASIPFGVPITAPRS